MEASFSLYSKYEIEEIIRKSRHDMIASIRHIECFNDLILDEHEKPQNSVRSYAHHVQEACLSLKEHINFLKALKEIQEIYENQAFAEASLDELMSDILNFELEELLKQQNGIVLIENTLGMMACDKGMMRKLFIEIIRNGLLFNESKKPIVKIKAFDKDGKRQLIFKDNGVGFDLFSGESNKKVLFRRENIRLNKKGRGLNLLLCEKIVEAHMGEFKLFKIDRDGTQVICEFKN